MKTLKQSFITIVICLVVLAGVNFVYSSGYVWTNACGEPGTCNVGGPINIKPDSQNFTASKVLGVQNSGVLSLDSGVGVNGAFSAFSDAIFGGKVDVSGDVNITGKLKLSNLSAGNLSVDASGNVTTFTPIAPVGMIAMFDVSCPADWQRFTDLDNRVPRGASTYGNTTGATGGTHVHTGITSGALATGPSVAWSNIPYRNVIWCKYIGAVNGTFRFLKNDEFIVPSNVSSVDIIATGGGGGGSGSACMDSDGDTGTLTTSSGAKGGSSSVTNSTTNVVLVKADGGTGGAGITSCSNGKKGNYGELQITSQPVNPGDKLVVVVGNGGKGSAGAGGNCVSTGGSGGTNGGNGSSGTGNNGGPGSGGKGSLTYYFEGWSAPDNGAGAGGGGAYQTGDKLCAGGGGGGGGFVQIKTNQ